MILQPVSPPLVVNYTGKVPAGILVTVFSPEFVQYALFLIKIKEGISRTIGQIHAATLYWQYEGKEGNFRTEGEILEVKPSSVVINCVQTVSPTVHCVIPHREEFPYATPERFLSGVHISLETTHQVNPWDVEIIN